MAGAKPGWAGPLVTLAVFHAGSRVRSCLAYMPCNSVAMPRCHCAGPSAAAAAQAPGSLACLES